MRTNIIAAAVALAIALFPSAALAEKTRLTAVSGPVSGGWYLGVGLVAKAFTDANPNYEVTMLPGNSTSNVIQLQQKKADLSIGMHTMNMAAIKGTAPYKKAFPQHRRLRQPQRHRPVPFRGDQEVRHHLHRAAP